MAYKKIEELMKGTSDSTIESLFEDNLNYNWSNYSEDDLYKLRCIFEVNMKDKSLFPNLSTSNDFENKSTINQIKEYLFLWGERFLNAKLPSKHEGTPSKSPYDAMIYKLLSLQTSITLNKDEARKAHELAMQSENIIGELLEEFIAKQTAQYGWIWCKGAVMVATDFYFKGEGGKEVYLQIKNKYNTENSSSSKVRVGTNIKKWNRLINKRIPGTNEAQSNWSELQKIMFDEVGIVPKNRNVLSESSFSKFIESATKNNPSIII